MGPRSVRGRWHSVEGITYARATARGRVSRRTLTWGPALQLNDGFSESVIDMHLHTLGTSSDSMLDPLELPEVARTARLTGYNLAEHDQVWERHRQMAYRNDNADLFINFGI